MLLQSAQGPTAPENVIGAYLQFQITFQISLLCTMCKLGWCYSSMKRVSVSSLLERREKRPADSLRVSIDLRTEVRWIGKLIWLPPVPTNLYDQLCLLRRYSLHEFSRGKASAPPQ